MNSNTKGNIALGQAIAYFTMQQYVVSLPLNDCQCYDLIIEKDNCFQSVQVKYTGQISSSGNYVCKLITTNPVTQKKLYSIVEKPVDLLFCYCENGDMFLIPIKEIKNTNTITLYSTKPNISMENLFDTSIYCLNNKEEENISIQNIEPTQEHNSKIKEVYQYTIDGEFIKKFNNCCEAVREIKPELTNQKKIYSSATVIGKACRGERKTAYGFQWKYKS